MGDDGSASSGGTTVEIVTQELQRPSRDDNKTRPSFTVPLEEIPTHARIATPPLVQRQSLDGGYFSGPRDVSRHSKWPLFLQLHGSIMPKMIVPLFMMAAWSTLITAIDQKVTNLGVDSILLTVLGFVVSTGLSFRGSTAYERYSEGRRLFASLVTSSQALGRIFWIHCKDVPNQEPRRLLLKRLGSMNLVVAFAYALKHSLRFEPYTAYPDLEHLVGHLDTFAKVATENMPPNGGVGKKSFFKNMGEDLGLSFATSNPRKVLKRASEPLGNLPLEILNHIAVCVDMMISSGQLTVPIQHTVAYNNLAVLNDVLTGCQRVLNTPLPIAFSILFEQITWLYVILLPFQLVNKLDWISIPATVAASYIILGLLMIDKEIENPFGHDVNDLPLDLYCDHIAADMDIIASYDNRNAEAFLMSDMSLPLYPVSSASADVWMQRSESSLKETIKTKPKVTFQWKRWSGGKPGDEESGKMD